MAIAKPMNRLHLKHYTGEIDQKIQITGSKSESNRLLILQQLYPNLSVDNLSNSDDTRLVQKALANTGAEINIGHAGTAMRFLTGYLATKEGADVILTGSGRMKERPIQILVDALKTLGADISYVEKEGFAPLKIKGAQIARRFCSHRWKCQQPIHLFFVVDCTKPRKRLGIGI